jgi:hypothetical protein
MKTMNLNQPGRLFLISIPDLIRDPEGSAMIHLKRKYLRLKMGADP